MSAKKPSMKKRTVAVAAALAAASFAAVLVPRAAHAAVGDHWNPAPDQYREIRFEQDVLGWHPKSDWSARCPTGFPYLDSRAETKDRRITKGIIAWEADTGVELTSEQKYYKILPNGTKLFTGVDGYAYNHLPWTRPARVDMVCTNSLEHASKDAPGPIG
jgi:hypothetical protein